MAKLAKLGVGVLAAIGGFFLGLIIYAAFLYKFDNDSQVLYWIFNIVMALVCGLLTIWLYDHMIIISTAIVGSYLFVRGISMYAGGFPGEVTLINDLKMKNTSNIDPTFYAYMVGFVLASIFSIILQYKYWGQKEEYKHPYHYTR